MLIGDTAVSSERAQEIAVLTDNHLKTVQRWFRVGKFPRTVELLIRLVYGGELGLIAPEWDGFWIQRRYGCLVTDQGYTFAPGEIRAFTIRQHYVAHLKLQIRELQAKLDDKNNKNGADNVRQIRLARRGGV